MNKHLVVVAMLGLLLTAHAPSKPVNRVINLHAPLSGSKLRVRHMERNEWIPAPGRCRYCFLDPNDPKHACPYAHMQTQNT